MCPFATDTSEHTLVSSLPCTPSVIGLESRFKHFPWILFQRLVNPAESTRLLPSSSYFCRNTTATRRLCVRFQLSLFEAHDHSWAPWKSFRTCGRVIVWDTTDHAYWVEDATGQLDLIIFPAFMSLNFSYTLSSVMTQVNIRRSDYRDMPCQRAKRKMLVNCF